MNNSTTRTSAFVGVASLLLSLSTFLFIPSASAAIVDLSATLDGSQANAGAGTGSPATGSATMTYDDVSDLFSWNISWTLLQGSITVAHFHGPAALGQNAGVQVDIGAISGLASPSIGSTTINSAQAADLLAGLWYINIHSNRDPGGEIRGQVNVIPIPATAWLFGSALLGLVGLTKRKSS